MDLQDLLDNYFRFSYEAKRYLDDDENPIKPYRCLNNVIEITTKKIILFYYDSHIDVKQDYFSNIPISFKEKTLSVKLEIKGMSFEVIFNNKKDYSEFAAYYKKYAI